jgi:hypothetical protein
VRARAGPRLGRGAGVVRQGGGQGRAKGGGRAARRLASSLSSVAPCPAPRAPPAARLCSAPLASLTRGPRYPLPNLPGRHQLQSTTDKLKTMAVKRESLRQQSFKAAADAAAAAGSGGSGGAAAAVGAAAKDAAPQLLESNEEGE